jgi:transposase-like protein
MINPQHARYWLAGAAVVSLFALIYIASSLLGGSSRRPDFPFNNFVCSSCSHSFSLDEKQIRAKADFFRHGAEVAGITQPTCPNCSERYVDESTVSCPTCEFRYVLLFTPKTLGSTTDFAAVCPRREKH